MTRICPKCDGEMEPGFTTALGLLTGSHVEGRDARLLFVVTGEPTPANPIAAFRQGLAGEAANRQYPIFGVRCPKCGLLELYATERPPDEDSVG